MNRRLFMILALILFALGLFLVFNSVTWGQKAANSYLLAHGGGMDSAQFMVVLQESVNTYKWVGGILALIGGLGLVRGMEPR